MVNIFGANMTWFMEKGMDVDITGIRKDSIEAGDVWEHGEICLLFIDGYHSYTQCLGDFMSWKRHLIPGARVLFHDYTHETYGVKQAVDELYSAEDIVIDHIVGSMAVCHVPLIQKE